MQSGRLQVVLWVDHWEVWDEEPVIVGSSRREPVSNSTTGFLMLACGTQEEDNSIRACFIARRAACRFVRHDALDMKDINMCSGRE